MVRDRKGLIFSAADIFVHPLYGNFQTYMCTEPALSLIYLRHVEGCSTQHVFKRISDRRQRQPAPLCCCSCCSCTEERLQTTANASTEAKTALSRNINTTQNDAFITACTYVTQARDVMSVVWSLLHR